MDSSPRSDARPFRPATLAAVILAVASCCSLNCIKQPPPAVTPTWDVDLTFPVSVKSYTLADLVDKDSSSIRTDPSHGLTYCVSQATPGGVVGSQISIVPGTHAGTIQLGSFSVTVRPAVVDLSMPSLPTGQTQPFPSTTIQAAGGPATTGLSGAIVVKTGMAELTLANNLPVDILPLTPVTIVDEEGMTVASFDFAGAAIPPRQSRTLTSNLAGCRIVGDVAVGDVQFSVSGSSTPVTMPADSGVVAAFRVSDLRVSSAEQVRVPSQRLIDNDRMTLNLSDSTIIQSAVIRNGTVQFQFASRVNDGLLFRYRLEQLYRQVGGQLVPYEDSIRLAPLGRGTCTIDLAGVQYRSRTGIPDNSMQLTSTVALENPTSGPISLHDTDKVDVSLQDMGPIVADSLVGILKPTWVTFGSSIPFVQGSFFSKFKAQCVIPQAGLTLTTLSSIGFPSDLYLTVSGRTSSGRVVTLDLPATQRRVNPGAGSLSFDGAEVGQFLTQFSGAFPESLSVAGRALVNPPDCYAAGLTQPGSVGSRSAINGQIDFRLPLNVGITQATYRDTAAFGTDENNRPNKPTQDDLSKLNSGRLIVDIQNLVPAAVRVKIHLLDINRHCLLTIPQDGRELSVPAAGVDANGYSAVPGQTRLVVSLGHDEVMQYIPAEFVDYETELLTTPGVAAVRFRTTDAVSIRVWTECSYGVNR